MNNLTARVILVLFPCFILLMSCRQEITTPVLVQHEERYPELRKKYIYQSLIRLANVDQNPDFESLIKDLHKIVLYLPPKKDSTYQITDVREGMIEDGYEQLLDVRTADAQRISLWVKESKSKSHYLALINAAEMDVILEMDGEIHPEYLSSIASANQESLKGLLKGGF